MHWKIDGLEEKGIFEFIHKKDLPTEARLLNSIWSYRCKQCPNGVLWKHKACFCVDGSRQIKGLNYPDSYAPITQWSMVRLVVILSTMLNLKSWQVNFTQSFTWSELNDDVYMCLHQCWQVDETNYWCIRKTYMSLSKQVAAGIKHNLMSLKALDFINLPMMPASS